MSLYTVVSNGGNTDTAVANNYVSLCTISMSCKWVQELQIHEVQVVDTVDHVGRVSEIDASSCS